MIYNFRLFFIGTFAMMRPSFFAATLALTLIATPAMAKVDKDMEAVKHFVVTPALIQKLKNAENDLQAAKKNKLIDDDNENDDDIDKDGNPKSIEAMVQKIERDPKAKAMLAKHHIGPREMVMASYAMLHAGMWVATESVMNKKKAATSYAALTTAQKANIELMRSFEQSGKKK